jgi:hypothetical protein
MIKINYLSSDYYLKELWKLIEITSDINQIKYVKYFLIALN